MTIYYKAVRAEAAEQQLADLRAALLDHPATTGGDES